MKGVPSGIIEKLYCKLLDINYQEKIFGALKGFERKGEGYIAYCPFHYDVLPTLIINSESPRYFYFACGANGDWVHYLMNHKSMSFGKAMKALAKAACVQGVVLESQWKSESMRSGMLETAMTVFTAMLFSHKGRAELNYLNSRGYMGEEIEHMGLGLFPGYKETREILEKDFKEENVADVFLAEGSDRQMLAIPYRDSCGRLMGIYGMMPDDTDNAYIPLTGMEYLKDTPLLMYKSRDQEQLVAVEGFFDTMLSDCIGIKGAIGVGKGGITPGMLKTAAGFRAKVIILALSSKEKTKHAISLIGKTGLEARIVRLPEKYDDVDAFIRDTCINKFGKLIDKAVAPEEWLKIEGELT